jgi:hypothetical protein
VSDSFSDACRDAIAKGMQWSHANAFPILDVLRCAAIKSPGLSACARLVHHDLVFIYSLHFLTLMRAFPTTQLPTRFLFAKRKLAANGSIS